MFRPWFAMPLFCGIALFAQSSEQSKSPDETKTHQLGDIGERIVRFVMRSESVGFTGSVIVAKDGKVVAAVGVGSADLADKVPNTPATLFEIASATKQLTAAACVRLAQDGKLQLDDTIDKHLPDVPE